MSRVDLNDLNSMFVDVFKELGNIGAGNATTALAHMLNIKVDMSVPEVSLLEFKDAGAILGGEEQIMAGVYLSVEGDVTGSIMFILNVESAKKLANMLMGIQSESTVLDDMEMSALKEIGNIITSAYLNSLSTLTGLKILPSPPDLCIDMAGAILSVPAIEFGTVGDRILLIQTRFTEGLDGFFILVPDLESYDTILNAIGM